MNFLRFIILNNNIKRVFALSIKDNALIYILIIIFKFIITIITNLRFFKKLIFLKRCYIIFNIDKALNFYIYLYTSRKDIGYLVEYLISSGLISRDSIGKSSLNIISLKRYRDGILMEYLVRRYIYRIVSRNNIFIRYSNNG